MLFRRNSWICVAVALSSGLGEAQPKASGARAVESPVGITAIPEGLRQSLDARLSLFIAGQAEGQWDMVASMLGRYWRDDLRRLVLTSQRRACLISQMQNFPVLSFDVTMYTFSTAIYGEPAGRRWWFLTGDTVVKTESGEQ